MSKEDEPIPQGLVQEIEGIPAIIPNNRGSNRMSWRETLVFLGMVAGGIAGSNLQEPIAQSFDGQISNLAPLVIVVGMAAGGFATYAATQINIFRNYHA